MLQKIEQQSPPQVKTLRTGVAMWLQERNWWSLGRSPICFMGNNSSRAVWTQLFFFFCLGEEVGRMLSLPLSRCLLWLRDARMLSRSVNSWTSTAAVYACIWRKTSP